MKPSSGEVASHLTRLIGSPWPRTPEDVSAWLEAMGVEVHSAKEASPEGEARFWYSAEVPNCGTARAGWVTYRGEPASIHWFLWSGKEASAVWQEAKQLAETISARFELPQEVTRLNEAKGGSWYWEFGQHSIELYAHCETPRSDDDRLVTPCIQLHVNLIAVSQLLEAEAQRLHGSSPIKKN